MRNLDESFDEVPIPVELHIINSKLKILLPMLTWYYYVYNLITNDRPQDNLLTEECSLPKYLHSMVSENYQQNLLAYAVLKIY